MNGNDFLLDTNILVDYFIGKNDVKEKVNKLPVKIITTVVLGELYVGINRVAKREKHLKYLNDFLLVCELIKIEITTTIIYGEIMASLLNKGRPIPTNDVWIAASAKQHGFTIITRDKHFAEIEGLSVEFW